MDSCAPFGNFMAIAIFGARKDIQYLDERVEHNQQV